VALFLSLWIMIAPDERREKVSYEINRPPSPRPEAAPAQDLPPPPCSEAAAVDGADREAQFTI